MPWTSERYPESMKKLPKGVCSASSTISLSVTPTRFT